MQQTLPTPQACFPRAGHIEMTPSPTPLLPAVRATPRVSRHLTHRQTHRPTDRPTEGRAQHHDTQVGTTLYRVTTQIVFSNSLFFPRQNLNFLKIK